MSTNTYYTPVIQPTKHRGYDDERDRLSLLSWSLQSSPEDTLCGQSQHFFQVHSLAVLWLHPRTAVLWHLGEAICDSAALSCWPFSGKKDSRDGIPLLTHGPSFCLPSQDSVSSHPSPAHCFLEGKDQWVIGALLQAGPSVLNLPEIPPKYGLWMTSFLRQMLPDFMFFLIFSQNAMKAK